MSAIRMRKKPDLGYHLVSKLTIIDRLVALGKFDAVLTALKSNPVDYEKWSALTALRSDDKNAINLFLKLGLNPKVILK